jgi:hypothetical protein
MSYQAISISRENQSDYRNNKADIIQNSVYNDSVFIEKIKYYIKHDSIFLNELKIEMKEIIVNDKITTP